MLITIISDASFCHHTKRGGYGIWVASKRGKKAFGGAAHGHKDNTVVECIAVANGLYHGIEAGLIYTNDTILFQTDCKAAIKLFEGKRTPREEEVQVYKWFMDTIVENKLSFQFRHIKGHTSNQDQRSKAQRFCDERARSAMRLERSKIRLQECKELISKAKKKEEKLKKYRNQLQQSARLDQKAQTVWRRSMGKGMGVNSITSRQDWLEYEYEM